MKDSKKALDVHPAANLFPMMAEKEFAELVEDIRQHGQEEQIIVWRGQLLDGRNRLKACEQLGIQPNIGELDGDLDPVQYVLSHNLHRRHLTETQRSMVAAKLANLRNGQKKVTQAESIDSATSLEDAAGLLGVGRASVQRARKVIDKAAPALIEAVERGEVAVSLAAKLVDECDDKREQARLAQQGKEAIREFITPPDDLLAGKERKTRKPAATIAPLNSDPAKARSGNLDQLTPCDAEQARSITLASDYGEAIAEADAALCGAEAALMRLSDTFHGANETSLSKRFFAIAQQVAKTRTAWLRIGPVSELIDRTDAEAAQ